MDEQQRVAAFVRENDLETDPAYRLLDLVSELGEVAKDVAESTDYGDSPGDIAVHPDEIGDTLFSLLALAEGLDVDASAALDEALAKYEGRIDETRTPSSGR